MTTFALSEDKSVQMTHSSSFSRVVALSLFVGYTEIVMCITNEPDKQEEFVMSGCAYI